MAGTIAGIRDRFGSVEEYLAGPAGVPEADLDRLRSLHLDAPSPTRKP
jgi:hypothetical protein